METTRVTHTLKSIKPEQSGETYQQQATDWLDSTDSTMEIAFSHTGKYWPDDKEERDVYNVTLKRRGQSYTFTFGQCTARSHPKSPYWQDLTYHERKKLMDQRQQPDAYSILACLDGTLPGTFEDWCGELGYDTDSRQAEKTYRSVVEQYMELARMYTPDELQRLSEIA